MPEPVESAAAMPLTSLPDEQGHFGPYGGKFVAETLMGPIEELRLAYERYLGDPDFLAELDADLKYYVGRNAQATAKLLWDMKGNG